MKHWYKTFIVFLLLISSTTLLAQPGNDACANATLISSDSVCVTGTSRLTGQTLTAATNQAYTITSPGCSHDPLARDIWYKFVAKTKNPTITISNQHSNWGGIGNVRIQVLTGTCATSFTQVACGVGPTLTPSLTSPLTPGVTYYIRIHKNTTSAITTTHTFDICITDPWERGGRTNEVFSQTVLSGSGVLQYPWEITYGRDNYLWITESKGYKVYRMDPNTGVKTTVLDISQGSAFTPSSYRCQFANGSGAQGGLAGLALHPNFMDGTANEKNFVYISYIYSSDGGSSPNGINFTNRLVRFTYNVGLNTLELPALIATLPGSSDHNSQRITIAPVVPGGKNYLFYASGDMGSGQFGNRMRTQNAQNASNVEGKILRYNLDTVNATPWIPTNPYSANPAVWSIGMRNNQGLVYDSSLNILYGSSHGAYSDDEINIIDSFRNYGHPLVIGYADGNYNGTTAPNTDTSISAGAPRNDNNGASTCPPIGNEITRMNTMNAAAATMGAYKGPLFSAYPTPRATLASTWLTNPPNAGWYSEGWSGLDLYQNKLIPGWHKSLVAAGLKWGRLIRLKLSSTGRRTLPSNLDSANVGDTITYFQSANRYRDLTFGPNGKDIFLVMDNNAATSGPGVGNPIVAACPGCVIKYSFLGYADAAGASTIPSSVNVTNCANNTPNTGTTVTIDGTNNFLWVPITGSDGNILAEINAMGQNLGVVTSTFYENAGTVRRTPNNTPYLDRSITISPQFQPSVGSPVKVRLYLTAAEVTASGNGVTGINQVNIFRNADANPIALTSLPVNITPTARATFGSDYVLTTSIDSIATFYFANSTSVPIAPLFVFSGSALSSFSTSLGTPSAQQSYTISGYNLAPNVSNGINVTAPANYEVSLTSGSFTGTPGNTVTLSSNAAGKIVGEPRAIYVRYNPTTAGAHTGNITHSGAGVSPASNVAISGNASAYYYSKASGALTNMATWGIATDGSGFAPTVFSTNSQTFEIRNRPAATITANWIVTGTSSKIIVGSGSDFTIPSGFTVTGTVDVAAGGELTLVNTVLPTFGTLAANSTVEYAQTAAINIPNFSTDAITYSNLKLSGTGTKTFKSNSTTVTGNLIYDGLTNGPLPLSAAMSQATTLNLGGDLTYLGSVTNPNDINTYTLNSTSGGTQTITGNNNVARFFRIVTGATGNNIVLSATGGTTHAYVGNANAGGLTLSNGTTLSLGGNTLTLTGPVNAGTGTLTGSPTSNIVIGGTALNQALNFTQTSESTRSLNNLTLNNASSATLGTALDVYGTIALTTASLNLNARNLTLKSNAANTARIANLTGSTLTGGTNVTMERWIKLRAGGTGRAYRLLAPTVNTAGHATRPTMKDNWMEGGMNTAIGTNVNPVPLFGTQITGAGGNANGFDVTQTNQSSAYAATNAVVPTYTTIANTGVSLNALTGYFMYIRGDRSTNMQIPLAPGMPTSSTTLRATGTVLQGTQTSFTNSFTGGGALNLVTNPYPSPIDWSLVKAASSNITDFYTIWDPNFGTRGGFVTISSAGIASSGLATQFIQSGQAFFVESNGAGIPSVSIQESHKTAGNNNEVFLTPPPPVEAFRAELYFTEPNAYRRVVDGAIALFNNKYSAAVDNNDAKEINNWDENIAINRAGNNLAIEGRPVILTKDTLPLFMNNMKEQSYEFEFTPAMFTNPNLKAELIDNFLNTRTLLSVTATSVVPFIVTADPASKASDRFKVVFGAFGGTLAVDAITIKARQKNNGVQVDWTSRTEMDMASYEVEKSTNGTYFAKVNTTPAIGNSTTPVDYNWFDANPNMGSNFYRVKGIDKAGNTRYSQIVKVTFGKGEPSIVVYPNPVKDRIVTVQLKEMQKDNYQLRLINTAGQAVYTQSLKHNGGNATQTIVLGKELANGVYLLEITSDNIRTTKTLLISDQD